MAKCDICNTQIDREQIHRRGIDCAGPISVRITEGFEQINTDLAALSIKLERVDQDLKKLSGLHEKLAARVTRIEYPKMAPLKGSK